MHHVGRARGGERAKFQRSQKTELQAYPRISGPAPGGAAGGDGELGSAQAPQKRAGAAKAAVKNNAQTLFDSSRQVVVGNAQGDVTLVEFFDYNCGYCKRALTDLTDLMKDDSKLRVVLKEFPVLGPGSQEAAQVAIAARMQDKSGKKYFDFHQRLLSGRGQADRARALAAAKEAGFDMAKLERDMASPEVKATIEENMKLAEQLGLNGTPSYVVGSDVVVGAVGFEALKGKVKAARCTTASC
jgi:protein-disulfide isomerase